MNVKETATIQPKSCFPAGTPVATNEGLRPIETIRAGDQVWAYDLVTSQWRLCRVKLPYSLPYKARSVFTTVAGETIESTYRHPYWVLRGEALASRPWLQHLAFIPEGATTPGRWVDSCDLQVGDEVLLWDGRVVPVERVEFGPFEGTVYNMEVEELQCYTVGRNSVLVHNNNGPPNTGPTRPTTNSAGSEVQRTFVQDQDALLAAAEQAAGGSLEGWKPYKPGWWESPDGKTRIEWQPGGHANTNEGPHVTVREFDGQRHAVVAKIFIEGWEQFKRTFGGE